MSRLLPLRRLRWQLTLFYILITLVAALTLEVGTVVVGVVEPPKVYTATPAEILINAMAFTEGPQLVPYLEQSPPDQHGLDVWAHIWTHGFTFSKQGFVAGGTGTSGPTSQIPVGSDGAANVALVITGQDGKVIVSASAPETGVGDVVALPQAQAALQEALNAGGKPGSLFKSASATLADGRTVAAVPVMGSDRGQVLGALLVAARIEPGPKPPALGPFPINEILTAFKNVLPNALALVALASVVGTLFGLLASRGITRRLSRITLAARAWSRGELTVEVRDRSQDEVGQLARGLNTMAEQLQTLLATREELAVVEERNRLARELHDAVKQQVFATAMQVAAAQALIERDPAAATSRLTEAAHLAGEAQRELTTLIQELRPAMLASKGLAGAIRDYAVEWSRQSGIAADVRAHGERPVPLEVEQALFRVAQEALANVARHSGATRAHVWLAWEQGTQMLGIQDNGQGFDGAATSGKGVGLQSMRERTEALGGTFLVASRPGETRIEAHVPLPTVHAAHALVLTGDVGSEDGDQTKEQG
jgi:signal transduction histidine kinase